MTTDKQLKKNISPHPINPDVRQRAAANPNHSVWVAASAGSGKTKVLTDRILRLLLPDKNGYDIVEPQKILALTFTKAGASEMRLRVNEDLGKWAVMPLKSDDGSTNKKKYLYDSLEYLLGMPPTDFQINIARQLFAKVIDVPGGLKIMTIHSFCTSILGRFPLEAGLYPNFKAIEEDESKILLEKSMRHIIRLVHEQKGSDLSQAFFNLALLKNEDDINGLIQKIISERRQITKILKDNFGAIGLYTKICQHFEINDTLTKEYIYKDACLAENYDEKSLRAACAALASGSASKDLGKSISIQKWLDSTLEERISNFTTYSSIFFTNEGNILKTLATKQAIKNLDNCAEIMMSEAERIQDIKNTLSKLNIATATRDLFLIGEEILNKYTSLKESAGVLDYDDLILTTLKLLTEDIITPNKKSLSPTPWIRYKLDQGIDHILVDEAQDTNPEQWEIIQALCDDFFADQTDDAQNRTLFVVGDEKQSIYRFQRAAPEKFNEMRQFFSKKIKQSGKEFNEVPFITSFRSTPAILNFVDAAFENDVYKKGLGSDVVEHESFRRKQPGLVTLWPLFKNEEKEKKDAWLLPTKIVTASSGAQQLANHIADTIEEWIQTKRILYSYNRPVQPQDIMILLRTRNALLNQLVRALKTRNIPVTGVDRMVLNDQLAIQDLCAAAQFALLPDDDLTLAGLLKSPFIGLSEEELFDLAYNRGKISLWDRLRKSNHTGIFGWLNTLNEKSGSLRAYDFFAYILQSPCPQDSESGLRAIKKRLGDEALDPIEEFMNITLSFEQDNTPCLQEFLSFQEKNTTQLKRDLEESGNMVRIMTAHGAKGLQSPIVIMPDTIRSGSGNNKENLYLPYQTEQDLPYFCANSKSLPASCQKAKDTLNEKDDEEYRRLFYVAATRAESELYIGGYYGKYKPKKESWYDYALDAFGRMKDVIENPVEYAETPEFSFNNPEIGDADRIDKNNKITISEVEAPNWLHTSMPNEPTPIKPITPSRQSGYEEEESLSPLATQNDNRFKRGNIIHKLLQILPDINSSLWTTNAQKYLNRPLHDLTKAEQEEILAETLNILNHPDFSPIFGPNSRAEVPINSKEISGQIDRLLVTDTEVLIVDYKTNRPPPEHEKDVQQLYIDQMNAYENSIRKIYPNHTIKKALIWTNAARLMILS